MEKKRTSKGASSRQRLLEAAAERFAAIGYHRTKVSDIVKAAGLSQAAFYLYYPGKEALFAELVAQYRERLQSLANAGSCRRRADGRRSPSKPTAWTSGCW